jgi:hypothetical protein
MLWSVGSHGLGLNLGHDVVHLGLVEGAEPLAVLEQQRDLLSLGARGLAFDVLQQRPHQGAVDDELEGLGFVLGDLHRFVGDRRRRALFSQRRAKGFGVGLESGAAVTKSDNGHCCS